MNYLNSYLRDLEKIEDFSMKNDVLFNYSYDILRKDKETGEIKKIETKEY